MADPVTIGAAVGWGISIAGWFISPFITRRLNQYFSDHDFHSTDNVTNLEIKIKQLKLMLEAPHQAIPLGDLEPLMKQLQSAFFKAEDILEDIDYHHRRTEIERGKCKSIIRGNSKKQELKKILETIVKLVDEGHRFFSLRGLLASSNSVSNIPTETAESTMSTTSTPPDRVFGLEEYLKRINIMLFDAPADDEPSSSRAKCYSIIGIYGIPGSGKTTLAQQVYKDVKDSGKEHFNCFMWIHVSQIFSVEDVWQQMLESASVNNNQDKFSNPDMLKRKLEDELDHKRFLLVLDDVWCTKNFSESKLDQLLTPLCNGKRGSKILVTTRTINVADALGVEDPILMSDMDEVQYFNMFMHYATDGAIIRDPELLREHPSIGRKIAEKLGGLPLAAKVVAGQLRMHLNIGYWKRTLDSKLSDIAGALWWSYGQLEGHVRQCFIYCAMFPRRYELEREELVHLWMAQGFLHTNNVHDDIENIGHDYIDELHSLSFLQQNRKTNSTEYFKIHDLLHELAERVAGNYCFRIEKGMVGIEIPQDVRHLYIESCRGTEYTEQILSLNDLRTLFMPIRGDRMRIRDFKSLLKKLKKLRVLQVRLQETEFWTIPKNIGKLKHLRLVGLFGNPFLETTLPPTFTKLYYLQKIHLQSVITLYCSSKEMASLVDLHHMTCRVMDFPDLGKLTRLRTLLEFTVKREKGFEIQQLEELKNLQGSLLIKGIDNVGSKDEARQAKLEEKNHLSELTLEWGAFALMTGNHCRKVPHCITYCGARPSRPSCSQETRDSDGQEVVLEALGPPPPNITILRIRGYNGSTYPRWLSGWEQGVLQNLQRLELLGCQGSDDPPKMGKFLVCLRSFLIFDCSWNSLPENMEHLTSLVTLSIARCKNIRSLSTFPRSLRTLELSSYWGESDVPPRISEFLQNLSRLEIRRCSWNTLPEDMEHLASLQELTLLFCHNMVSLPRLPSSLKKFTLHCCNRSLKESCQNPQHPNWDRIKDIRDKKFV